MDAIKASVLEKLIRELCPEGVEYRELSELFKTKNGYTPSKGNKEFWENGNIPWFRMDDIRQNGGILSHALQNVTEKAVKGELFPENSLIVATTATIGEHALITVPSLANQQFTCLSLKEEYKNQFVIKFLYYYCFKLDEYCKKNLNQGSLASVDRGKFSKFKFPLPPLPIQQEIVRILDTFTNLTAELTAELTARRKQYEYYRDELLTFGEDVPKLCLSEIATEMYRGSGIKRDEVSESGIPCVRYGEIYTTYDVQFNKCVSHVDPKKVSAPKYFEYGDVLFAITGESVSDIAKSVVYLGSDICLAGGDIVVMKHKQNPRYMAYALSTTNAQIQKSKGKVKSKVVHSSMPSLREIRIPIPSLIEQEKIANILDNFRKLCNGFDEGLPAEISTRQKQYEYYRDKLLQFSV